MTSSADGRYIFMAFPGGLSLQDAAKRKVLHTLDDDRLDLCSLQCTIINAETYLLTGIDEIGMFCFVYLFFICLYSNADETR